MVGKEIRLGLDELFWGCPNGQSQGRTGRRCLEGSGCGMVSLFHFSVPARRGALRGKPGEVPAED